MKKNGKWNFENIFKTANLVKLQPRNCLGIIDNFELAPKMKTPKGRLSHPSMSSSVHFISFSLSRVISLSFSLSHHEPRSTNSRHGSMGVENEHEGEEEDEGTLWQA